MPLVTNLDELKRGQAAGYAVPLFVTFEPLATDGMIAAAEEKRAPMILAFYDGMIEKADADAFAAYVRTKAARAAVPVALMLDHGASFEQCVRALAMGFTGVMFGGSRLPVDDNIARTREVVRAAHAVGALCEGEIGQVGSGHNYDEFGARGQGFSDPAEVERFVAETGVDCVAIAIGTAHGEYNGEPKLDLDRLAAIRKRVGVPLVLHGGSGLSEEQFRAAIAGGVAKVNIFTDLGLTCARRLAATAKREKPSYFDFTAEIVESFRDRSGYYMDLFGASGTAR